MQTQINDLVLRHDLDSLFEIMVAGDDEFLQLDAAEGLVQLGDRRGLKFLEKASKSIDKDIRDYASEIMDDPGIQRMREQVEAEVERQYQARVGEAKQRIQKGKKVFRYKVIFVPAMDILQEDYSGDGTRLPDLDDAGLEGWEVINVVARRQLKFDINDQVSGAYAILKKEMDPDEVAELDEK